MHSLPTSSNKLFRYTIVTKPWDCELHRMHGVWMSEYQQLSAAIARSGRASPEQEQRERFLRKKISICERHVRQYKV